MFAAQPKTKAFQVVLIFGFLFLAFILGAIAALFGGIPALVLFAPILVLILLLLDYRVGVVFLMIIIAFQHTPFLPSFTGFNIVNYVITGTFFTFIIGKLQDRKIKLAPFPTYFWWAYILPILAAGLMGVRHIGEIPPDALLLLGDAYSDAKSYLSSIVIKPFFLVLLAWMVGTASLHSRNPRLLLVPLAMATALPAIAIISFVAATGFNLKILSGAESRGVLGVLGMHANEFGFLLATGLVLLLFVLPTLRSGTGKFMLIMSLGAISIALLLTFSRGGYVIALIGIVNFFLSRGKARYIFFGLLMLAIVGVILPEAFWDRVTTGFSSDMANEGGKGDALTAGRIWVWQQLWPSFLQSPFWGSGLDSTTWSDAVKARLFSYNHPHNLYMRILLDMGIIGFGLLTTWLVRLIKDIRYVISDDNVDPTFRALARGLVASLWGILLAGFTNGHFTAESEYAFVWIALGLLLPYFPRDEKKACR